MKFYGQFSNPSVDEYLYKTFFKDTKNGVFIECGAYDGILESSCKVFEEFLGWTGINIEPDPDLFNKLIQNRPNSLNLNIALTSPEESGTDKDFYTVVRPDGFRLGWGGLHDKIKRQQLEINNNTVTKVKVKTKSFPSLIEETKLDRIDLFVLDVEGYELEVLKGLKITDEKPKVLCVEYPNVGILNIDKIVKPLGYKFHSFKHNNVHYTL